MTPLSSSEISVIVQGPILTAHDGRARLTHDVLLSVRRILPHAEIILSTWAGSDTRELPFDVLIESKDPGPQVRPDGPSFNLNRQVTSTKAGLDRATRRFAVKLRTDCLLVSERLTEAWSQAYPRSREHRLFEQRILACELYFRSPVKDYHPYLFHISDICHFGLTSDLRDLWDCAPMPESNLTEMKDLSDVPFLERTESRLGRYTEEQYLWINFLRKKGYDLKLDWIWQTSPALAEISEHTIVNNFAILSCEAMGLRPPTRLYGACPSAVYSHQDWLDLLPVYCDADRRTLVGPRLRAIQKAHRRRVLRRFRPHWPAAVRRLAARIVRGMRSEPTAP